MTLQVSCKKKKKVISGNPIYPLCTLRYSQRAYTPNSFPAIALLHLYTAINNPLNWSSFQIEMLQQLYILYLEMCILIQQNTFPIMRGVPPQIPALNFWVCTPAVPNMRDSYHPCTKFLGSTNWLCPLIGVPTIPALSSWVSYLLCTISLLVVYSYGDL